MNIKKVFMPILFILSLSLLVSCGGDGGGSSGTTTTVKTTGQFIDDPVWGLDYSCSSGATGVTNLSGEYTCNTGDDVTFSIGPVALGTLSAQSSFVTPYSLFPNDTVAAINLSRLLQSLDSDSDPNNNVLTLDPAQLSQLPVNTDFTDPDFVTNIETALGITLIDAMTAMSHLNDAIIFNGGGIPDGRHIPVANAGTDTSIVVENSVLLNGDASSDADGDPLTYLWNIASAPAGSTNAPLTDSHTSTPELTPDVVGDYVIQLVVNDGVVNSAADMVTVTATANGNSGDSPPPLTWINEITNTYGGAIALDSDDNLYMASGCRNDFNGETNAGFRDLLLIKYDPAGDMQWSVLTGSPGDEWVDGIAYDKTRNVLYVTGSTGVFPLHEQPPIGSRDIFLVKYDADGNRIWTIMDGTDQEDSPLDIALDSAGNIFLAGYTKGNFDENTAEVIYYDLFITKYSSNGTKIWTRQLHGNDGFDIAYAITVDSDDYIYITGSTNSSEFEGEATSGYDAFIIKYDNNGNKLWVRMISGTGQYIVHESGSGIVTDLNDNVYVTGSSTGDLDGNSNAGVGESDQFVSKYNTNGALIWTTLIGGPLGETGFDIVINPMGHIYTAGRAYWGGQRYDYVLAMFDTDGQNMWTIKNRPEYTLPGTNGEGKYITIDSVGNIYVTGPCYGSFISSDNDDGNNKVFIAKYNDNTSTGGPYTVGGTVITYSPTGQITADLILKNNGGDDLTISSAGSFTFATPLSDGASYHVEIFDSGGADAQECTIESGGSNDNGSGTIDGADVTDIIIECHPV